ncbi:hypothetical protein GE061_018053 [Apolygus lucorum]|uniref:Uncharacterized protein n=1 Tax=Apolygus lucorum TaxID=248454 RepID=A0A8S9XCT4_APOLU|nr:hypothetical protein GE061_018053 [Apolygus lucorum]
MDDLLASNDYFVSDSNSRLEDSYATWLIEGGEETTTNTTCATTKEPSSSTTEFRIPYESWETEKCTYMDLEEPDPLFWVYLAGLLTITLLTFLLAIASCSVIADIRRQKDEASCCLDEMEDDQDKNCDEDNVTSFMATIGHGDPKKLEAQYQDVVQKYLKQHKKIRP